MTVSENHFHDLVAVDTYRRAARNIVEADLPARGPESPWAQLARLGQEMHAEAEPIRSWAQSAVCEEVQPLYGVDPDEGYAHGPDVVKIQPMRRLRQLGRDACPTCLTPVPTQQQFSQWDALAVLAARRRDARRGAIDHGRSNR
jgi:hypothetical protein